MGPDYLGKYGIYSILKKQFLLAGSAQEDVVYASYSFQNNH